MMGVSRIAGGVLVAFILYRLYIIITRLYFHPLANFPGPKLAAATTLYRAYYQVWKDGKMIEHSTQLHEIYGPVVRTSPTELHFRRPEAYHDIFSSKFDGIKDPDYYAHLGSASSLFGMSDPVEHKHRFRSVASLFSKPHIDSLNPMIKSHVQRFRDLLFKTAEKDEVCQLSFGFRSVLLAIVNEFTFASLPENMDTLQDESFCHPLTLTTHYSATWLIWLGRNFPLLAMLVYMLPWKVFSLLSGSCAISPQFMEILTEITRNDVKSISTNGPKETFLHRLATRSLDGRFVADGTALPESILIEEALSTMLGGTLDMANALPYGTFCVSQNEELQEKIFQELKSVWPDSSTTLPDYDTLRHLPLLDGVVKESLRLTYGVIVGPPRLVGSSGAHIDGYYVPPKTVVATSSVYLHLDPSVFPNPDEFDPLRWAGTDREQMQRSLVPFSKGRRMCPASYMSYMELFSIFAMVFRSFKVIANRMCLHDFEISEYLTPHFRGKPLEVKLEKRI
ncbi:cytochrome P450 [Penicillium angulare]|uniref:cytochrome P450 n=1 Tax=Penicillium angulare TaxID=116970 RepID=UPI00253FE121|nr:cytochrome P450 [Penicillium angulare]KAJ5290959.1 cytochrome P450 [Penicillium angulare]